MKNKEIVHILIAPSSRGKLHIRKRFKRNGKMDHCARRAGTEHCEQLKFLWIHKVKNFCGFTKMLFSRMTN